MKETAAALFSVIATLTILSGCASEDSRLQSAVMEKLRQQTRDPASTQFENQAIAKTDYGTFACGKYNAKNAFGAYVGFIPYMGDKNIVKTWDAVGESQKIAMLLCLNGTLPNHFFW